MPLCLSLSIFGAEKESAWAKPLHTKPSRMIASSYPEDQSKKIDFLKEKIISLKDAQTEQDAQWVTFIESHQKYVNLSQTTMIRLSNTVKEQKAIIEQLKSQQPVATSQQEIIALKATIEEQKTTIEQLKSQQPVPTPHKHRDKLKRRLTT